MKPNVSSISAPGRFRWTICGLLFAATTINYMDRQILGILAPRLQTEIGWNEVEYGHIVTAFQIAYALGLGLMGRVVDLIGTRLGYSLAIAFWSLAAMGHALVQSVFGFSVARFALGLGEGGNFPAAIKTIAEWFPKKERALATGLFNSGANFGAILAPALVPSLTLRYGWRAAFVVLGAAGFVWIVFWVILYQVPDLSKRIGAGELALIRGDSAPAPTESIPWRRLLVLRQTWAYMVAVTLVSPVWWFFLYWLPKFLSKEHGLDLSTLGLPLIVIYVAGCLGSVGGGWLSSALLRRGWTVNAARKTALVLCASLALPVIFAPGIHSLVVATGLIAMAAAANQGYYANLYTTASDLFPRRAVATVVGLGGMVGSIFAAFFAEIVGHILQASGQYTGLFLFCGSAYLVSAALFHLLAPRMIPAAIE